MEWVTALIKSTALGEIQPVLPACFTMASLLSWHW